MTSRPTHDIVATIGEYTDKQSGQKKKRYLTIGKCFTDPEGRQSIKLDALPIGPAWSGWLSLYPIEDKPQPRQPARQSTATTAPASDDEDDIPF